MTMRSSLSSNHLIKFNSKATLTIWYSFGSTPEFTMTKMAKILKHSKRISKISKSSVPSAVYKINSMISIITISLLSSVPLLYQSKTLPTWMVKGESHKSYFSAKMKKEPNLSWATSRKSSKWVTTRIKCSQKFRNWEPNTPLEAL